MRTPRHRRGVRAVLLTFWLVTATTMTACTTGQANNTDASRPERPSEDAVTCATQKTKEPCTDIELDGRTWRYAFLPAAVKTPDAVVLDFGGPGHSVLSGEVGLSTFLSAFPDLGRRYNIVVPEEPWVTQPITATCQEAQGRYYLAARTTPTNIDAAAKEMAGRCGLADGSQQWGFNAPIYQRLVEAISERHGLTLTGFIGHSWGSVRLGYLDTATVDWAILVRPFPVGIDQAALIAERADALSDLQADVRPINSTSVTGRSLPVTPFDQYSAMVDLGYIDDRSFATSAPGVLRGTDAAQIGRLSDGLWMRYGRHSLSPGTLAQFQETCAGLGAVADPVTEITSVGDVLKARQIPCRSIPSSPVEPGFVRSMCIVSSALDTVIPGKLIHSTYAVNSGQIRFVESKVRSHSSFDGLDQCLTKY